VFCVLIDLDSQNTERSKIAKTTIGTIHHRVTSDADLELQYRFLKFKGNRIKNGCEVRCSSFMGLCLLASYDFETMYRYENVSIRSSIVSLGSWNDVCQTYAYTGLIVC
jgi:hypothetical protein